jgi:hypothetical protein
MLFEKDVAEQLSPLSKILYRFGHLLYKADYVLSEEIMRYRLSLARVCLFGLIINSAALVDHAFCCARGVKPFSIETYIMKHEFNRLVISNLFG